MRPVTLRNGLVLIVVAALLPIGALSIVQALANLRYSRTLISNRLATSALATAVRERDPLIISRQILQTLSENKLVRAGGAGCQGALIKSLGASPALLNLARSDALGRVKCSVLPYDPSISFANQQWWQRGIAAKKFTVSALVVGQISKKRALIAMLPIAAEDGQNIGAVTVAIDASWLEYSLADAGMAPGAAIAIVDGTGRVILTRDPRTLPRFDVHAKTANVVDAMATDGVAWMYAVAPLYDHELYVVYAEPAKQLMATAVGQVQINLILPIIALLLASLALWIGTNRLVLRWLESLRDLAAQFATGSFVGEPDKFVRAPREIGLLSNDLHAMAHAIEARDHDLQDALAAKTALTHDIHHRVKNNLQIVSSLLNLQAGKISDPAAREALGQTRARIGALAQIHRLLYEQSHGGDHDNVNISSLLHALCSQLRALHREQNAIHLSCYVAAQTVPVNNAVPLALLTVEAVTNAYRHGIPKGRRGAITVNFAVKDDEATLCVRDDGIGFDVEQETQSMGRQLMAAFAQQLGGDMDIVSNSEGSVVTLRYPLGVAKVDAAGES